MVSLFLSLILTVTNPVEFPKVLDKAHSSGYWCRVATPGGTERAWFPAYWAVRIGPEETDWVEVSQKEYEQTKVGYRWFMVRLARGEK